MRNRRHLSVLAFLALTLGAIIAPIPALAGDTTNVAGRPIDGNIYEGGNAGNCMGISYGRVQGSLVMFVANHCRYHRDANGNAVINSTDQAGDTVYGANGTAIGVWGAVGTPGAAHDLSFFYVNSNSVPAVLNRIYRGSVSGSDFWYITALPSSGLGCDDWANWDGDDAYQMSQPRDWTTYTYRIGVMNHLYHVEPETTPDGGTNCTIKTNLPVRFETFVESSSPIVKEGNTARLFGWATGQWNSNGTAYITVTPAYDGFKALDDYYSSFGNRLGVTFCIDADC